MRSCGPSDVIVTAKGDDIVFAEHTVGDRILGEDNT